MSARSIVLVALVFVAVVAAQPVPPDHAAKMAASQRLFAETVRPFLVAKCLSCHGGGDKTRGGFDLATREALLKGGDRGAAVVPGKSKESPLLDYVAHRKEPHMPPKTLPPPAEVVEALAKWIDLGAAYDKPLVDKVVVGKKPLTVTDKDRDYWAYRKLAPLEIPNLKSQSSNNPIDAFILAKLEAAGVKPVGEADRRTLIRRVTFDLTGLPPTPEEVEAFVAAPDGEKAYEAVVDRLLASPHFGERWARHWLDPVRFAESHGFEHDYLRPHAYHYRDFVIKAFNKDLPYDTFVRWQLAGDEIAPDDPLALAATGFLGAGVFPTQITNREAERIRYDAMDDMLATTGHAMLALTVGCARCHDHKYDPIPAKDYYRMLACFTTTVRAEIDVDLGTPAQKQATAAFEARLAPLAADVKAFEEKELPGRFVAWVAEQKQAGTQPPTIADANTKNGFLAVWDGKQTLDKLPAAQRAAVLKWFAPQDAGWKERQAKVAAVEKDRPKDTRVKMQVCGEGVKPMRHHTADGAIPDFYPQTFQLQRGDVAQRDGVAEAGFLQVLSRHADGDKHWQAAKPDGAKTSYRRTALANWLTDREHGAGALLARVIANRLWHHHFGRGLVATVNDFGLQGDAPTHPELLEWLAGDLVAHGWSLKHLHKRMVMSQAYRRAGTTTPEALKADPDNRLWWHRPRRRLEAEAIRDNLLAVGGVLDRTPFGPGTLDEGMKRRSIYFTVKRSQLIPTLQVFDWPDTLTSAGVRPVTVVAPQALLFLNSPHVRTAATGLAGRLRDAATRDLGAAVEQAYQIAFARPPRDKEKAEGVAFLTALRESRKGDLDAALTDYAQALLGLNEFIYVE